VHWYMQDIEGSKYTQKDLILRRKTRIMIKRKEEKKNIKIILKIWIKNIQIRTMNKMKTYLTK
jgi:hypothetical protein